MTPIQKTGQNGSLPSPIGSCLLLCHTSAIFLRKLITSAWQRPASRQIAYLLASSLMAAGVQADPGAAAPKSQQPSKEAESLRELTALQAELFKLDSLALQPLDHLRREEKAACIGQAFLEKKWRHFRSYHTRRCLFLVAQACLLLLLGGTWGWIAHKIVSNCNAFMRGLITEENIRKFDPAQITEKVKKWSLRQSNAGKSPEKHQLETMTIKGLLREADDLMSPIANLLAIWASWWLRIELSTSLLAHPLPQLPHIIIGGLGFGIDTGGDNMLGTRHQELLRRFLSILKAGIELLYFLYKELIATDQGMHMWDVLVRGKLPADPLEKYELAYVVLKHLEMASYPAWQAAIEEAFAKGRRDPAAVEEAIQQVGYLLGLFYATAPELRPPATEEKQREILSKAERLLEDYDPEIAKTLECWLMQTIEGREQRPLLLVGEPGYGKTYLVKELCKLLQEWGELGVIYTEGKQSNTAAIAERLALTGANEKQTTALLFDELDKTIHLPGMLVSYLLLGDATEKGLLTMPGFPLQMHLPNQFWICNSKNGFPPELVDRAVPLVFTGFTPDQLWNIFQKGKLAEFVKAAHLPPDCLTEADFTHIRAALGKIKSGGMRDAERVVRDCLIKKRRELVCAG